MKRSFAAVLSLLLAFMMFAIPANAVPYFVSEDESAGGRAYEYLARIEAFRRLGTKVHLPERCASSCTLYTALLSDGLVCSRTGDTRMVFHQFMRQTVRTVNGNGDPESYWLNPPTREDVQRTWGSYPWRVRWAILIRSPSGLPEIGEIEISSRELGIPTC